MGTSWTKDHQIIIQDEDEDKETSMNIIQCYAPTNDSHKRDKYQFHSRLQSIIVKYPRENLTILMRDFNAMVGMDNTGYENIMGRHGLGERNENGERLTNLCVFNKMTIGGTIFTPPTPTNVNTELHAFHWATLWRTKLTTSTSMRSLEGPWKTCEQREELVKL